MGRTAIHVRTLNRMFNKLLDDTVAIDVQNPIQVNERTQVYPDLMLIPSARSLRTVPVPGRCLTRR